MLPKSLRDKHLLLASQSPRRRHILAEAGFQFRVRPADIDESFPDEIPLERAAEYVAKNKAIAILPFAEPHEIVLSADSMVILEDVHYAKPQDADEAVQMLTALAGKTHLVVTGVCLLTQHKMRCFSGLTHVTLHPMSEQEIRYYVEMYKPLDKAGAYGVQEWIGLCKLARLDGTYTNVMGLPMDLVYRELQNW